MSANLLHHRITETAARCRTQRTCVTWLAGAWGVLVAAAGLGLADVLFPLAAPMRAAGVAILMLATLTLAIFGLWAGYRAGRRPAECYAVRLERAGRITDNAVVNGVQFSRMLAAATTAAPGLALMQAAVAQGQAATRRIDSRRVIDQRAGRRHALVLAAVLAALCASAVVCPDVWAAILPRFYDPEGDHPPYCGTTFTVRFDGDRNDGRIHVGDSARVLVDLAGRLIPDRAWLVLESPEAGDAAARVDLFRKSERQWFTRFHGIQQPIAFRVHVPRGYSRLQRLVPDMTPRITEASVRYEPPPQTAREPYVRPLDGEGIREVRGTTVTLTLTSNRPLGGGEVRAEPALPAAPASRPATGTMPNQITATFTLDRNGRLTARVKSADGLWSRDQIDAEIHALDPQPSCAGGTTSACAKALPNPKGESSNAPSSDAGPGPSTVDGNRRDAGSASVPPSESQTSPTGDKTTPPNAQAGRKPAPAPESRRPSEPLESPDSRQADLSAAATEKVEGDETPGNAGAPSTQPANAGTAEAGRTDTRPASPPEGIHVEIMRSAKDRGPGAPAIRGERIPAQYRELTEAYFRRLAEDGR